VSIFPSSLEDRCSSTYWLPIKTDEWDGILSCQRETSYSAMLSSVCGPDNIEKFGGPQLIEMGPPSCVAQTFGLMRILIIRKARLSHISMFGYSLPSV